MSRRQLQRRLPRCGAYVVMVATATGLGMGVAGPSVAARPAGAATLAGAAVIVNPSTAAPLTTGNSKTPFTFKLPDGSGCTGDSAADGYRINSYIVPQSVPLDSLRFTADGPVPVAGEFRAPMFDMGQSPYVQIQTANAVPAGGPGPIIQPLPGFDFAVYDTTTFKVAPGVYSVGIACTKGAANLATQLDRYWNGTMTITADPADPGPAKIKWVVTAAAPVTTTTMTVSPFPNAPQGTEVTLAAAVVPATAIGTVTFKDGTMTVGAPVTVTSGTALLKKSDMATGAHYFTATFAPTTPGAFATSVSAVSPYAITAVTGTTTTVSSSSSTSLASSSSTSLASSSSTTLAGASGGGRSTGGVAASSAKPTELAKTGGSFLPLVAWSLFLICLGRAAVLLGRRPSQFDDPR